MIPMGIFMQPGSLPQLGRGIDGISTAETGLLAAENGLLAQADGSLNDSFKEWFCKLMQDRSDGLPEGDILTDFQKEILSQEQGDIFADFQNEILPVEQGDILTDSQNKISTLERLEQPEEEVLLAATTRALLQIPAEENRPAAINTGEGVRGKIVLQANANPATAPHQPQVPLQPMMTPAQPEMNQGGRMDKNAVAGLQGENNTSQQRITIPATQPLAETLAPRKAVETTLRPEGDVQAGVINESIREPFQSVKQVLPTGMNPPNPFGEAQAAPQESTRTAREAAPTLSPVQQASVSADENPAFQDRSGREPESRIQVARTIEKEMTDKAFSDPMKSAGLEQPRPTEAAPEIVKPHTVARPHAMQASAPVQPETPAASTLQSSVVDQIVERASLRSFQGRSEIKIQLKPEFLGNVQMSVAADKEQLVVRVMTDQVVVKEAIEANLHHLKSELQNLGLTVDRFDVTVNPDAENPNRETFTQAFKQPASPNGQRQGRQQEPEAQHQENGQPGDEDSADKEGLSYFA
jgi:flagellar hook-length control protein FliK